jgi:hypothetical protein
MSEGFHSMRTSGKMIDDTVSVRQRARDRRAKRDAPIHADRCDILWLAQAFGQGENLLHLSPQAHFSHLLCAPATEHDGGAVSFAHGKRLDPQERRCGQGFLVLHSPSPLLQVWADQVSEAIASKARTHTKAASDVRYCLRETLLSDGFAQAPGGSPTPIP